MKYLITLYLSVFSSFALAQFVPNKELNTPFVEKKTNYADINGDGAVDIITLSKDKGQLLWIENIQGTGYFQDYQPLLLLENIEVYEIFDFDGDEDLDLVVLTEDDEIAYFVNNGQGIFSYNQLEKFTGNTCHEEMIATDIDSDGLTDILVKESCSLDLGWYKNLGNGFSEFLLISENTLKHIHSLDFDLDGDMDLIGFRSYNKMYILENLDGKGTFSNPDEYIAEIEYIRSFEICDLNDDGYPDILYGKYPPNEEVVWLQNMGDGTFVSNKIYDDNSPNAVAPIDLDGDGDLDIVGSFSSGFLLAWFENVDGNGKFVGPKTIHYGEREFNSLYASDIDSDEKQDLFVSTKYGESKGWIKNIDGQGTFSLVKPISGRGITSSGGLVDESVFNYAVANIDGNDGMDIIYNSPYGITYLKNLGKRHFSTFNIVQPVSRAKFKAIADLDGDGDLDIIAIDTLKVPISVEKQLIWFQNDGHGNYSPKKILSAALSSFMVMEDIDQDGDMDIIAGTAYSSGFLYLLENLDGKGNFSSPQELFEVIYPKCVFLKDIDGDGLPDLIMNINSPTQIVWYKNLGNNTFAETANIIATATNFKDIFIALDFDKDGDIDIAYMDGNDFYWYENHDALGSFSSGKLIVANGFQPSKFIFHDVDSDNDFDLVYAVDGYDILRCHYQESPGVFGDFVEWLDHSNVELIHFIDLDGDGDQDLISNNYRHLVLNENYSKNPTIMGSVYWDQNNNGIKDDSEIDLYLQKVTISPSALVEFTNPSGQFKFPVNPGEKQLSCKPSKGWGFLQSTDSTINLDVPFNSDTIIHNFGLSIKDSTIQISADLSSGATRCGFTVPFWLTYENQSSLYLDGYLSLKFDSLLFENDTIIFQEISPAPDSIIGLYCYWHIDSLASTQQQQIEFSLVMPGVDFLGEYFDISMNISATSSASTFLADTLNYIYTSQINCSYDPNDKIVQPSFDNFNNYTLFSDSLYYTIRFQNTGTDTAFTVRVEDQLSTDLDFTSFRPLAASHEYTVHLDASGKIIFTLNNILLPPESTNQISSQGFVKFLIIPKEGVSPLTTIYNTADIYFDYNPPIITNTVTNILVEKYPIFYNTTAPLCHNSNDGTISISFPPKSFDFRWKHGETTPDIANLAENDYSIKIFNQSGILVADSYIEILAPQQLSNTILTTPTTQSANDGSADAQPSGGTPPYSYNWGTNPTQTTKTAINLSPAEYSLTITDTNGCSLIQSFVIEETVSLNTLIKESEFYVTPNPSTGECAVHFKLNTSNYWTLELTNVLGQTIKRHTATKKTNEDILLLENLENGVYFIILTVNNDRLVKKIIVARD